MHLAAMIDVCLCSNVYSPLTSRPQIWPTRERGENVSAIRRSYVVNFYAWVVKTSRCKLQPISLRAHLSSKGQVLRTYVYNEKCVDYFPFAVKNSALHLWIVITRWWHTCSVVFIYFNYFACIFLFHVRKNYIITWSFSEKSFELALHVVLKCM